MRHSAQGATGGSVMLGLVLKWFPLCEFSLFETPFEYTVEMRNRFKELYLIDRDCLMNYGQRFVTLYRRQESRPSLWKRNAKKQNAF